MPPAPEDAAKREVIDRLAAHVVKTGLNSYSYFFDIFSPGFHLSFGLVP